MKTMVITVEKSIKETRFDLNMGFSNLETVPRILFSEKILDVIIDDKNNYDRHFIVQYLTGKNWEYIDVFGNSNNFCKLLHTGGHLVCN